MALLLSIFKFVKHDEYEETEDFGIDIMMSSLS